MSTHTPGARCASEGNDSARAGASDNRRSLAGASGFLLLACLCAALFLPGISDAGLHRNEGLRALAGAEILRDGSWLVPTLHGLPQLTKPPGQPALIALCSLPLGGVTPLT